MVRAADGDHRGAMRLASCYRHLVGSMGDDHSEAVIAVDDNLSSMIDCEMHVRAWVRGTTSQLTHIRWDTDRAVRVDTAQVGLDKVRSDDRGVVRWHTGRDEDPSNAQLKVARRDERGPHVPHGH
jgi:hypothetical protein